MEVSRNQTMLLTWRMQIHYSCKAPLYLILKTKKPCNQHLEQHYSILLKEDKNKLKEKKKANQRGMSSPSDGKIVGNLKKRKNNKDLDNQYIESIVTNTTTDQSNDIDSENGFVVLGSFRDHLTSS